MGTIETIRYAAVELQVQVARPPGRPTYVSRLVRTLRSFARWIDGLMDRRRSRLVLLEMTDAQLKDIGISRCDAHREGLRPFWD
ncbi:DUF1127 domain-containing protein [Mesorhizobium sp. M0145]|uniref:DUF1127 domain-containing protein n=1 Tax=unclassified Mesorhizobium TaxID=325217 RepID=UPI0033396B41